MGSDAPWEDKSKTGTLSLEAVVYGEDLPQLDLGLLEATAQPDLQANLISVTATVHNTAMLTVSGFTTKTMLEGTNEEYTNHFDVEVEPYKTRQVSFTIPYTDDASIRNNIVLKIESLDDGTDAIADNNTVTANVSFARKVLIEEFTTEACINCPRVAKDLHEVMKLPQYENKIVAVCHHAGYYTDPFTQKCDEDLLFLYGGGGTYAPA